MPTNDLTDCNRIDPRDVRALTEVMSVLDDIGRARGADDLYLVVSSSGREYLVDICERVCECPDFQHNLPTADGRQTCKHLARVTYETGMRPIPAWVDRDTLDDQLGMHIVASPRIATVTVATDGGRDDKRPDDCECPTGLADDGLVCWPCYRAGREEDDD